MSFYPVVVHLHLSIEEASDFESLTITIIVGSLIFFPLRNAIEVPRLPRAREDTVEFRYKVVVSDGTERREIADFINFRIR